MKYKFYLSMKGIWGRKRESFLLATVVIMSIVFSFSFVIFNENSKHDLDETRKNLYGEWYSTTYDVTSEQKKLLAEKEGQVSIAVRSALICSDTTMLGSLGVVDDEFIELGRIHLLSGKLPTKDNEITVTTSVLDSLGYSYELGQRLEINIASLEMESENRYQEEFIKKNYVLVGVLPAYDVYWKKENNNIINALISSPLKIGKTDYQVFWKGQQPYNRYTMNGQENGKTVMNEFAYPLDSGISISFQLTLVSTFLFTILSTYIVAGILMKKRINSFYTLCNLGATKSMLRKIVFTESIVLLIIAFVIGIPLGLLVGSLSTSMGGNRMILIPWLQLVGTAIILAMCCFISFLLVLSKVKVSQPRSEQSKIKMRKKVKCVSTVPPMLVVLTFLAITLTVGTHYLSRFVMMGYDKTVPYAALNIQSSDKLYTDSMIKDLGRIPEVEEISAIHFIEDEYLVTSEEIRESELYNEIYETNPVGNPIQFYRKGIVRNNFIVLSEDDLNEVFRLSDINEEDKENVIRGEGVVYYHQEFEKSLKTKDIYTSISPRETDSFKEMEIPISKGKNITISSNQFVNEEGHDYTQSNVFLRDTPVYGVVNRLDDQCLFANNFGMGSGSIFVSQEFYKKLLLVMEERVVTENEYSTINVQLGKHASFTTRKSIASIVNSRGGAMSADSYDLVNNLYIENSQQSFILTITGCLFALLSLLILWNIASSSFESERRRIGILQALGVSNKQLMISTAWKTGKYLVPVLAISNGCILLVATYFNQVKYVSQYSKIFVYGNDIYFKFPIFAQVMINIVFVVIIICIEIIPLYRMIKLQPIENIKEFGGV